MSAQILKLRQNIQTWCNKMEMVVFFFSFTSFFLVFTDTAVSHQVVQLCFSGCFMSSIFI